MKTFTQAIETVCDKRHARMMNCGMSESDAAKAVVKYLEHLETVWKKSKHILHFVRCLKQAYLY